MALAIEDIHKTAHATIRILADMDIKSCLVGSAASSLYGIKRTPNDVDILILSHSQSPAEIKVLITAKDSRFSLEKPTSNPQATYFILKYHVPTSSKFCCVDIFKPGMIHLPEIPETRVVYSQQTSLPVMPFFPILLHKIQAWIAHRNSPKEYARIKEMNDVQDIQELLDIAVTVHKPKLDDESWLSVWFLKEAAEGIVRYVEAHPETADNWSKIGFSTVVPSDIAYERSQ